MREIAAKYNSEEDKKAIANFVSERLQNIDKKLDVIEESAIKLQLQEVAEIVSLSYLAKKYFNKSRSWLYQRLNGNLVNGKPARFTQEELQTFNNALQDISKKIGSLVSHIDTLLFDTIPVVEPLRGFFTSYYCILYFYFHIFGTYTINTNNNFNK